MLLRRSVPSPAPFDTQCYKTAWLKIPSAGCVLYALRNGVRVSSRCASRDRSQPISAWHSACQWAVEWFIKLLQHAR